MSNIFYCGLSWDIYTSSVEGQIAKDLIAMTAANIPCEIIIVTPNKDADRLIRGFGLRRLPNVSLATFWIAYNVDSKDMAPIPEHTKIVVHRNLYRDSVGANIDFSPKTGYYIPEQGQTNYQTLNIHKPAPNWTKNTILDPAIINLWG